MEYSFINSGIASCAVFCDEDVERIFIPLLKRLSEMQKRAGCRILVFIAAPPGAGKTTLASFLKYLSGQVPGMPSLSVIGMDGFHRYQEYLISHMTVVYGQELPMVRVKGAPETFDLEKLKAAVTALKEQPEVRWPDYDRLRHNPVEDAIRVDGDIVILEGNYLLLDSEGWRELAALADFKIFLTADEELLRSRLIERKISSGVGRKEAEAFVSFSDMRNVRTVLEKSLPGDVTLRAEDGFRFSSFPHSDFLFDGLCD